MRLRFVALLRSTHLGGIRGLARRTSCQRQNQNQAYQLLHGTLQIVIPHSPIDRAQRQQGDADADSGRQKAAVAQQALKALRLQCSEEVSAPFTPNGTPD
jgi:hypothetical protein